MGKKKKIPNRPPCPKCGQPMAIHGNKAYSGGYYYRRWQCNYCHETHWGERLGKAAT